MVKNRDRNNSCYCFVSDIIIYGHVKRIGYLDTINKSYQNAFTAGCGNVSAFSMIPSVIFVDDNRRLVNLISEATILWVPNSEFQFLFLFFKFMQYFYSR